MLSQFRNGLYYNAILIYKSVGLLWFLLINKDMWEIQQIMLDLLLQEAYRRISIMSKISWFFDIIYSFMSSSINLSLQNFIIYFVTSLAISLTFTLDCRLLSRCYIHYLIFFQFLALSGMVNVNYGANRRKHRK